MRIHAIHMGPLLQMVEEEKTEDEEGSEDSDPLLEPGPLIPSQNKGHVIMQLNSNQLRNHLHARFTHSLPVNSCNWMNFCKKTFTLVAFTL